MSSPKGHDLSTFQKFILVTLRLAIGWHFLSEGLGKLTAYPGWSAKGYLMGSYGPFSDLFHQIAQNQAMLSFSDLAVTYGLLLAGFCLLLGLFTRLGCIIGIVLLTMFYVSYPPWAFMPGVSTTTDSNYMIVNKNVIECLGLLVVLSFPTGRFAGLDALVYPMFGKNLPSWLVGNPSVEA
ncbi:MAG: DoxX family membrane protein [Candidatus Omnitrophica bacterium]|nr:DoxX family membrane protein [Candidatus Omnitrophota bacterium]